MCLKTKGIFGNFAFKSKVLLPLFNSCCSGAMKAGVPMFSEHKTPRFRKRAKPKSDSFLGPWNHGETLELSSPVAREMIEWTPATWSLGIFIPPKPSRMIRVWKIKISYQRSLTQVRKPEVESKWRAALCWKTFRNVVNSIWKIDENTWK